MDLNVYDITLVLKLFERNYFPHMTYPYHLSQAKMSSTSKIRKQILLLLTFSIYIDSLCFSSKINLRYNYDILNTTIESLF